ncbi:hypothetical protein ANCDUO_16598 [Ancylostoma duodenale]|uniref:Reverse transcriptase domain-containing protein n=1 Tax=Ancylostoma duodenale TaxID=51022 RepID=A0A0C2CAE8_9BILA|nr:hypothetical protein ANCDUO_16598 [Ancylostoma duodenale]
MLERTAATTEEREKKLIKLLYANKNGSRSEAFEALVMQYSHAFAVTDQELAQTKMVEHTIDTGDAAPIKQKTRPIPLATRVELRQILKDFQGRKVIEPKKCVLIEDKVEFLGHVIDKEGIHMNPAKVEAILLMDISKFW